MNKTEEKKNMHSKKTKTTFCVPVNEVLITAGFHEFFNAVVINLRMIINKFPSIGRFDP